MSDYDIEEVLHAVLRTEDVIAYVIKRGKKKYLHADEIRQYIKKDYKIYYI